MSRRQSLARKPHLRVQVKEEWGMEFLSTGEEWGVENQKAREVLHYVNEKKKWKHKGIFKVGLW